MDEPIKIGKGILNQIKQDYYYTGILTKKGVFNYWMQIFKEFYEKYPYALKWDYEKSIREILDYYD